VRVDFEQASKVVHLLAKTMGIRAISRFTALDQQTILNILESAGEHCARLLDSKINGLKPKFVEVDELWSFVRCKQAIARPFTEDGDQFVFIASDRETKLIISQTNKSQKNCEKSLFPRKV